MCIDVHSLVMAHVVASCASPAAASFTLDDVPPGGDPQQGYYIKQHEQPEDTALHHAQATHHARKHTHDPRAQVPPTAVHTQCHWHRHTPSTHPVLTRHCRFMSPIPGGAGETGGKPPVPEPHPPGGRNSRPRPHTSRHQRPAYPQHTNHPSLRRPAAAVTATGPRWVLQTLKQACSWKISRSAICVQRFDDSLSSAIRTTYRISLRTSSLQ